MRQKTKLPPNVELPDDLSPFGRMKEVTKRLLAVPKEEIDRAKKDRRQSPKPSAHEFKFNQPPPKLPP